VLAAAAAVAVDRALAPLWTEERGSDDNAAGALSCPVWLLPARDVLSVVVMLASYGGRQVDWRGHGLQADTPPPVTHQAMAVRPMEGNRVR
jgi:ceramide glucosyltransferase